METSEGAVRPSSEAFIREFRWRWMIVLSHGFFEHVRFDGSRKVYRLSLKMQPKIRLIFRCEDLYEPPSIYQFDDASSIDGYDDRLCGSAIGQDQQRGLR